MNLRPFIFVVMAAVVSTAIMVATQQIVLPRLVVINKDAGIGILLIIPRSSAPVPGHSSDDAGFDSGKLGEVEA